VVGHGLEYGLQTCRAYRGLRYIYSYSPFPSLQSDIHEKSQPRQGSWLSDVSS